MDLFNEKILMLTNINGTTDSCLKFGIFWKKKLHWSQEIPMYPKLHSHIKELTLLMQLPWLQGEPEHSSISIQEKKEKMDF